MPVSCSLPSALSPAHSRTQRGSTAPNPRAGRKVPAARAGLFPAGIGMGSRSIPRASPAAPPRPAHPHAAAAGATAASQNFFGVAFPGIVLRDPPAASDWVELKISTSARSLKERQSEEVGASPLLCPLPQLKQTSSPH